MHESKFKAFIAWAATEVASSPVENSSSFFQDPSNLPEYAVQFVQQVNYGPLEAKRYFIPSHGSGAAIGLDVTVRFLEVTEHDLISGNFQKVNS